MNRNINFEDTKEIALVCINKLVKLGVLSRTEHHFELQDEIQDEINNLLDVDDE